MFGSCYKAIAFKDTADSEDLECAVMICIYVCVCVCVCVCVLVVLIACSYQL
jgi:hypothetical protein